MSIPFPPDLLEALEQSPDQWMRLEGFLKFDSTKGVVYSRLILSTSHNAENLDYCQKAFPNEKSPP